MKKIVFTILICLQTLPSISHPGIGLLYDGDQYIYYTDLKSVWRLSVETGEKEEILQNIHTHELYMDSLNVLYGEHYWYDESQQKFYNYIWRFKPNGSFERITDDREGENNDFSFIRNKEMDSYFFIDESNNQKSLVIRTERGDSILNTNSFDDIRWSYLAPDETLYFVDMDKVYSFSNELRLEAKDLVTRSFPFLFTPKKHSVFGVWQGPSKGLFVAIFSGRIIKKISVDGDSKRVYKSSFFWSPINGVFDSFGNLWLMEGSLMNDIRVKKISRDKLGSYNYTQDLIDYTIYFSLIVIVTLVVRVIKKNRSSKFSWLVKKFEH